MQNRTRGEGKGRGEFSAIDDFITLKRWRSFVKCSFGRLCLLAHLRLLEYDQYTEICHIIYNE